MFTMLKSLYTYYKPLLNNEEGQGMAEYGLILAVVAVVVVVGIALLGDNLLDFFNNLAGEFVEEAPAQ